MKLFQTDALSPLVGRFSAGLAGLLMIAAPQAKAGITLTGEGLIKSGIYGQDCDPLRGYGVEVMAIFPKDYNAVHINDAWQSHEGGVFTSIRYYASGAHTSWLRPVFVEKWLNGDEHWAPSGDSCIGVYVEPNPNVSTLEIWGAGAARTVNESIYRDGQHVVWDDAHYSAGGTVIVGAAPDQTQLGGSIGEFEFNFSYDTETRQITTLKPIPFVAVAYVNGTAVVGIEPVQGGPAYYRDPFQDPTEIGLGTERYSHDLFPDWVSVIPWVNDPAYQGGIFRLPRGLHYYGMYADELNALGTWRQNLQQYLNDNSYNLQSGRKVGELITYEVIEAHPAFDSDYWGDYSVSGPEWYAFQVACQLGGICHRVPIYKNDGFDDRTRFSAPASRSVSGSVASLTDVSVISPASSVTVTFTVQNGILMLNSTAGLSSAGGNGTASMTLIGTPAAINNVLVAGDFRYVATIAFTGIDALVASIDDGTRQMTTIVNLTSAQVAAPTGASTTALSKYRMQLQWTDNANNETGFIIERKSGAGAFAKLDEVRANVTSYVDQGLVPGTQYCYRIRACSGPTLSSAIEVCGTTMVALVKQNLRFVGTDFKFDLTGQPGAVCKIFASTDLNTWTQTGTTTLSSQGTATISDNTIGAGSMKYYQVRSGTDKTMVFGFTKVTAPPGNSLMGNQFGKSVAISVFIPAPAQWSTVYKYTTGYWMATYGEDDWGMIGWENDVTINAGEGFWFSNPLSVNQTLALMGEVATGKLVNPIPPGFSMRTSMVPRACDLAMEPGFNPVPGDKVYLFRNGQYIICIYGEDDYGNLGWEPAIPVLNPGEAFWIDSDGGPTRTWEKDFFILTD